MLNVEIAERVISLLDSNELKGFAREGKKTEFNEKCKEKQTCDPVQVSARKAINDLFNGCIEINVKLAFAYDAQYKGKDIKQAVENVFGKDSFFEIENKIVTPPCSIGCGCFILDDHNMVEFKGLLGFKNNFADEIYTSNGDSISYNCAMKLIKNKLEPMIMFSCEDIIINKYKDSSLFKSKIYFLFIDIIGKTAYLMLCNPDKNNDNNFEKFINDDIKVEMIIDKNRLRIYFLKDNNSYLHIPCVELDTRLQIIGDTNTEINKLVCNIFYPDRTHIQYVINNIKKINL